jgi:hypothetical protein
MQCPFNSTDENALARCLIRPVLRGGNPGPIPEALPNVLNDLIGEPIDIDLTKLREYLADNVVAANAVGGVVNQDVTRARFFVLHDTSSPEIEAAGFPANINESSWSGNRLSNWVASNAPTHIFINRVGESLMKNNLNVLVRATKYEAGRDIRDQTARRQARINRGGLFIHIELIQPRRRSRPTSSYFDIPPSPGFTQKQLERLALIYVMASARSNRWLLPAYHLSVDTPIADAHDDPQNFDMEIWLNTLNTILGELRQ